MKKRPASSPKKTDYRRTFLKVLGFLLFVSGFGLLVYNISKEQEQRIKSVFQDEIQVLRSQVRQLESKLVQLDRDLGAQSARDYVHEDFIKLFAWNQLTMEMIQGRPFRDPLEKIIELGSISEKSGEIEWFLDQSLKGIPTISSLLMMLDQSADTAVTSSSSSQSSQESFWLHPINYLKSHFNWDRFFIIRRQVHEEFKGKLQDLISQSLFEEALEILKKSPSTFPVLEKSLELCLRSQKAMKVLQERIRQSFNEGRKNEK